jgi:arginase
MKARTHLAGIRQAFRNAERPGGTPSVTELRLTRRALVEACVLATFMPAAFAREGAASALEVVMAPSNLGLRPPSPGHEPGTWKAPEALRKAGLLDGLMPARMHEMVRPVYRFEAQEGTSVRNGKEMRDFSEKLAHQVADVLSRGAFPLVLGGDCSILLGCLVGVRQGGGTCGLIHVDGHSDFIHPGNYTATLYSAAGMDLALASGRGERLLTDWGPGLRPLVSDEHIVQIGEREDGDADYAYPDIRQTRITRITVQSALKQGIDATARQTIQHLESEHLSRAWLHVDVDVLDQKVMPAVDSPGSPGFNFDQLADLVRRLRASSKVVGADISVFDPELDPDGIYARGLAQCLARAFGREV